MTPDMPFYLIVAVFAVHILATVFVTALPLVFVVTAPGKRTTMGKWVLTHYIMIAAAFIYALVFNIWRDPPIEIPLAIEGFIYAGITASSIFLSVQIYKFNVLNQKLDGPIKDPTVKD